MDFFYPNDWLYLFSIKIETVHCGDIYQIIFLSIHIPVIYFYYKGALYKILA